MEFRILIKVNETFVKDFLCRFIYCITFGNILTQQFLVEPIKDLYVCINNIL